MRNQVRLALLYVSLLALAACGSTPASTPSPTSTSSTSVQTHIFVTYTSPDNMYQISYPTGWQVQNADSNPGGVAFTGPNNQGFDVNDNAGIPGGDLVTLITQYCQAINPGQGPVTGTPVVLDGQTWLKAQCDAAAPANVLIVEEIAYKGAVYQIVYTSSQANFQADDTAFYTPMEQSFKFLT